MWIDLGIHTEVCMTRPQTCDVAGGALSFWMKLIECPDKAGIISSSKFNTTGLRMYRSGTVHSKSFVGKVLLRIKWKFELN